MAQAEPTSLDAPHLHRVTDQSSGAPCPTERVRKGERTRRRILQASRRVFARVGYQGATIRAIAAEAEVDKSSIIQYFGSKKQLFREAVHWDIPIDELTDPDPARTVENLARAMLTSWAADPDSPMAVLLRASMTSEEAADLLRHHISEQAVGRLAATLRAPDARLRVALVGAVMMGIASQRYILHMPDVTDADLEHIISLITPLLRTLLTGQ